MKTCTIKKKDQEDVLHMLWIITTSLESRIDPLKDILDKNEVDAAYIVLNRVGYTQNHPRWDDPQQQKARQKYLDAKEAVDRMIERS